MQNIRYENTAQTESENQSCCDEMSYGEMLSNFLGEFVPGRGRTATCAGIAFLFLLLTLLLWTPFGWEFYRRGPEVTGSALPKFSENQLSGSKIRFVQRLPDGTLTSQKPVWIREDLAEDLFKRLVQSGKQLSIYDKEMIKDVENALKEMFWIKEVKGIRKFYPTILEIEVVYRTPALLVIVKHPETGALSYVPVSSDCRILPNEQKNFPISMDEVAFFPVFCGTVPEKFHETDDLIYPSDFDGYPLPPSLIPGTPWDREKFIRDAVLLRNQLGDRWEKFGLYYLCLEKVSESKVQFCLVTRNGSRIHWGNFTPAKTPKTPKKSILNSEKIAELDRIYAQENELDNPKRSWNFYFKTGNSTQDSSPVTESQSVGE